MKRTLFFSFLFVSVFSAAADDFTFVYAVQSGGERVVEWQPGIGGGLGIDDKFRSRHHFGVIRLE